MLRTCICTELMCLHSFPIVNYVKNVLERGSILEPLV